MSICYSPFCSWNTKHSIHMPSTVLAYMTVTATWWMFLNYTCASRLLFSSCDIGCNCYRRSDRLDKSLPFQRGGVRLLGGVLLQGTLCLVMLILWAMGPDKASKGAGIISVLHQIHNIFLHFNKIARFTTNFMLLESFLTSCLSYETCWTF